MVKLSHLGSLTLFRHVDHHVHIVLEWVSAPEFSLLRGLAVSMQDWLDQHPEKPEAHKRLFLSEQQVRSFPQFKPATTEEIETIIGTLHDLALISYELFSREAWKNDESKEVSTAAKV